MTLHPEWMTILFGTFLSVAVCNGLIASFSSSYYKKMPVGRLTHGQLRIKQGNADLDQRLNVFVLALLFGFTSFRIIIITLLIAIGINFLLVTL